MPNKTVLKVQDWQVGELTFDAEYDPSPKVLRILADAIAEEVSEIEPVSIEIVLEVRVAAKKEVR